MVVGLADKKVRFKKCGTDKSEGDHCEVSRQRKGRHKWFKNRVRN